MAETASKLPNVGALYRIVRGTAATAAISAAVVMLVPHAFIGGFALLIVVGAGAVFVFQGSTLAALKLRTRRRLVFQLLVAVAVPGALTAYFVWAADAVELETFKGWLSLWRFIPVAILGLIGYALRDAIDREVPVRMFIGHAGTLFVICLIGAAGYHYESSDDDEHGSWYYDRQRHIESKRTGQYAVQFPLFVAAAYSGLVAGLAKRGLLRRYKKILLGDFDGKRFTTALLWDSPLVLTVQQHAAAAVMSEAYEITYRAAGVQFFSIPGKAAARETPLVAVFGMVIVCAIVEKLRVEKVIIDVQESLLGFLRLFYLFDQQKSAEVQMTLKTFQELIAIDSGPPKEWRQHLYDLVEVYILQRTERCPLPEGVDLQQLFAEMFRTLLATLE